MLSQMKRWSQSTHKGTLIQYGMHWKTKKKINRIIDEKLDACPRNKSVWDMLTEEEREVYNERSGIPSTPDRTYSIDWLMKNR